LKNLSRKTLNQLAVFIGLIALVFFILYRTDAARDAYLYTSWLVIVLCLIFLSNRLLTIRLDRKLPWLTYGNSRFYWQLGMGLLLSLFIINLSYLILKFTLTQDPPDGAQILAMNVIGIVLLLPTISMNFGIQFLKNWKNAQVSSESFQKESIKAELTALKNHLDPHFLFNNLNVLSSLISKDKKQSQKYLEKFAEVYRIILQSSSEELVTLHQELDFISAYMYLMQIRFEETIQLSVNIPNTAKNTYLPPLTLQMLIENAIKHNVVTETKPLQIDISVKDEMIIIQNNLQEKKVADYQSSKSGLKNIERRYAHFSEVPIEMVKTANSYIVKVPLINISTI
jgi:two-component system, LytTR family, sensor kinase